MRSTRSARVARMRLRAVCSGKVFSSAVKKAWVWNGGLEYGTLRNGIWTIYGVGTPEFKELLKGGALLACEDRNVDEFEGSRGDVEADGGLDGSALLVVGSSRLGPVL